jgi:hypothetical protein
VIHVESQPEPADFDERVRQPGLRQLASGRQLKNVWKKGLWRESLPELWRAYGGVCAYLVIYIPKAVGSKTVDHFVCKSSAPELAFDWSNFRLACSLMNTRKLDFDDVLDPFEVEDGWFTLELSTLEVLPASELSPEVRQRVVATIGRLRLNDPECREVRSEHYSMFLEAEVSWTALRKFNPFLTRELIRQGLVNENGERE